MEVEIKVVLILFYYSLTANNLFESIQQDDLERERSINRELQTRLTERDAQLKISERQNEKMKRQVMTTNTLVKIQQELIRTRYALKSHGNYSCVLFDKKLKQDKRSL